MSLHYQFPTINHIDDVLPHIAGSDDFIVVKKDGYTVINYVSMIGDTFPTVEDHNHDTAVMRRECRGLIFDSATGKLLVRRYHKFFNVGERSDVKADLSRPHTILEKLDGSMVSPLPLAGGIRWATKMGITDTSMKAEAFVAEHPEYQRLADWCLKEQCTPIFEWCSMNSRIVLPYPEDKLVLTAIRENVSGLYISHSMMVSLIVAIKVMIPVVQSMEVDDTSDITKVVDYIRAQEDAEGVVIRWDDGHMSKVKSDWYVTLHRAKDEIRNERLVARVVLEERVDDLLPILQKEDADKLVRYRGAVWGDVATAAKAVIDAFTEIERDKIDRKTFAITRIDLPHSVRSCVFALWGEPLDRTERVDKVFDWMKRFILKNCANNASFDNKAKQVLSTSEWRK